MNGNGWNSLYLDFFFVKMVFLKGLNLLIKGFYSILFSSLLTKTKVVM